MVYMVYYSVTSSQTLVLYHEESNSGILIKEGAVFGFDGHQFDWHIARWRVGEAD